MTVPENVLDELRTAATAAVEKHATNVVAYDVGERLGITDAFLICSAPSERQIRAISEEIQRELREQQNSSPLRREGRDSESWVLLDYGHMVVHIQHEQERAVYGMDRLYADVPSIDLRLKDSSR